VSYSSSFVDVLPLWALFLVSIAVVLLSIEFGWRLGNYRRQPAEEEKKVPISAAVGATLGLLAFLLAFTFSMAGTRFDNRKEIVLQEANAIGTTYLRADFLEQQPRDEAHNLLRAYTALRSGGASAIISQQGMAKAAALQDQLWAIADEAKVQSDSIATGLFIQSLNEMFDLDAVRVTALRNRIPDAIWLMLCVVTILSMAAMGYEFGQASTRNWAITVLLAIVFTTVILLIADLDRPQAGLLQVSQQPLLDVLSKIGTPMP